MTVFQIVSAVAIVAEQPIRSVSRECKAIAVVHGRNQLWRHSRRTHAEIIEPEDMTRASGSTGSKCVTSEPHRSVGKILVIEVRVDSKAENVRVTKLGDCRRAGIVEHNHDVA